MAHQHNDLKRVVLEPGMIIVEEEYFEKLQRKAYPHQTRKRCDEMGQELPYEKVGLKNCLALLILMGVFCLGVWAGRDGMKYYPERQEPHSDAWLER